MNHLNSHMTIMTIMIIINSMMKNYRNSHMTRNSNLEKGKLPPQNNNVCCEKEDEKRTTKVVTGKRRQNSCKKWRPGGKRALWPIGLGVKTFLFWFSQNQCCLFRQQGSVIILIPQNHTQMHGFLCEKEFQSGFVFI